MDIYTPTPEQIASVTALFVRSDSIYKRLGVDSYDQERDARNYPGRGPIIAHPPCKSWGRLRHLATVSPDQHELARLAVAMVRQYGGVLEHPSGSKLWEDQKLPLGPELDQYGGFTLSVNQFWWGHKAQKRSLLYFVGCNPVDLLASPIRFDAVLYTVAQRTTSNNSTYKLKEISKADRERTPINFARWLIICASFCKAPGKVPGQPLKAVEVYPGRKLNRFL